MATKKPLVNTSGEITEISTSDQIPYQNLATGTPTDNQVLSYDADTQTAFWSAALSSLGILVGGNGIDGNKTVSGTETMTATQFWDVLTVPNGATLVTDGYGIFANKIIISGTGKIANNGNNSSSPDWWTAGAGLTTRELGGSGPGHVGVANATTGAGAAGLAPTALTAILGGIGGASGASGAGLGGAGAAGASGGSATFQMPGWPRLNPNLLFWRGTALLLGGAGGACGAAGGGDGSLIYSGGTSSGGAGGAGVLAFCCGELDISAAAAGCIQAVGGSAPQATGAGQGNGYYNAGGSGGSGGGGGGYIYGLCGEITGTLTDALDASGGAGGKGGNGGGGSGLGGTGGTGGKGGNIDVCDLSTGTWYSARGVAGTAGSAPSGTTGGAGGAGGACKLSL